MDHNEFDGVLGAGTVTKGTLTFDGRVRIDGTFEGDIRSESTLVVGSGARVDAEIEVGELVVQGELSGSVKASERVVIRSTGRVAADVTTAALAMESGAVFNGGCRMTEKEEASGAGGRKAGPTKGARPPAGGSASGADDDRSVGEAKSP